MPTKGEAAHKRRTIADRGNGLEAWRCFYSEWEPQLQNRFGGLLVQVLASRFKGTSLAEFEAWDALIREYETQSGASVTDNVRLATIMNGLDGASRLLEHLQLNADKYSGYGSVRNAI